MTETTERVPHPGSRLDRSASAAAQAAPGPEVTPEQPGQLTPVTVNVRSDMPEETIPRTMQLGAANPYLPILPRDMRRRRAVIIPVTNDIVLCETRALAQQVAAVVAASGTASTLVAGAYVPKGTVVVLESRDWMFAAVTTTASASPVTVIAERYADPVPD